MDIVEPFALPSLEYVREKKMMHTVGYRVDETSPPKVLLKPIVASKDDRCTTFFTTAFHEKFPGVYLRHRPASDHTPHYYQSLLSF